jgi:hypothetical protein
MYPQMLRVESFRALTLNTHLEPSVIGEVNAETGAPWEQLTWWGRCKVLTVKALTEGHTFKDGILVVAACQVRELCQMKVLSLLFSVLFR